MALLNSLGADEGIDDTSGVFGIFPAPDEPLFLNSRVCLEKFDGEENGFFLHGASLQR
jgi:hypothetical protein